MSGPSIDLIKKMLDRDVSTRATIQEVLDHPWMIEDTDSGELRASGSGEMRRD